MVTLPGGRWTIDTEGGHVVVSVSLMRNGYEYGTVPDRRGTIHTESGHVVNSVSRMRSHPEYVVAMKHVKIGIQSTALTSDDLDTPRALVLVYCVVCSSPIMVEHYTCSTSFHCDMAALFYSEDACVQSNTCEQI